MELLAMMIIILGVIAAFVRAVDLMRSQKGIVVLLSWSVPSDRQQKYYQN